MAKISHSNTGLNTDVHIDEEDTPDLDNLKEFDKLPLKIKNRVSIMIDGKVIGGAP